MRILRNLTNTHNLSEYMRERCIALYDGTAMPLVGFGTFEVDGTSSIQSAIAWGYRLIDTAPSFGNERDIGYTLQRIFHHPFSPVRRTDVFVISKIPHYDHKDVFTVLVNSLSKLGVKYMDLYLLHYATNFNKKFGIPIPKQDNHFDILEAWKDMERTVSSELVKHIGLCDFGINDIEKICSNAKIQPANIQIECHPYLPQWELHKFCKDRNITLTAFSPLAAPYLHGLGYNLLRRTHKPFPLMFAYQPLLNISKRYSRSPAQIILRWLVQRGIAVIPKSNQVIHQRENNRVFDFYLEREDELLINQMSHNITF